MRFVLFAGLISVCLTLLGQQADSVVASGAKLELVGDGYKFTEGPATDPDGNVYFTDQPNDRILFYDFESKNVSTWMQPAGRSNGLYFANPKRLIACADGNNELWAIDVAGKEHEVLADGVDGRRFGGPNDCWVDSDGAIYFTDPLYKRPYWTHTIPDDNPRGVYRLAVDGKLTQVADDLVQPNGIVGDSENRVLFIADIGDKKTHQYKIAEDGRLADRELFCNSGSDGLTIDRDRRVYLTGGAGVTVYEQDGRRIETISVPKNWTANVTFAGPDRDHLFITAGDSVFVIKTIARGL